METRRRGQGRGAEISNTTNSGPIVVLAEPGQILPPSPARQRQENSLQQDMMGEYSAALEPASPSVAPEIQVRAKTAKKTADVRWTDIMRDKLVQQVYYTKAYVKTSQTMEQKFKQIQACLEMDRDFEILGTGKCWETFKEQWAYVFKKFKAKYAIEKEGANLSIHDPDVFEHFTGREKIMYDIALELERGEEAKKEKSEKERKEKRQCLTHEKSMLEKMAASSTRSGGEAPESGGKDTVASGLTDDVSTFRQTSSLKGFMETWLPSGNLLASPSKEELQIKLVEAQNQQLMLKASIAGMKLAKLHAKKGNKRKHSKKSSKHSRKRSPSPSSSSDSSSSSSSDSEEERPRSPHSSSSTTA